MTDTPSESVRLDIWLWRARFFKTRALSTDFVQRKGVRVTRHGQTRKADKAGVRICAGDIVTFSKAKEIHCVEILQLGQRRGPANEAQALYRSAPLSP